MVLAATLTHEAFAQAIQSGVTVILPIGSCEQHGAHLPIGTDNYIVEYLATTLSQRLDCLVMPTIQYGYLWSAQHFNGTFPLKRETLCRLLIDLLTQLEHYGVKNILILSGHNGNLPIIQDVARELADREGWRNIWYSGVELNETMRSLLEAPLATQHHADELETSMMLAIAPQLVHLELMPAMDPAPQRPTKYRPIYWEEFNPIGSFGSLQASSGIKGEQLLEEVLNQLIDLVQNIIDKT